VSNAAGEEVGLAHQPQKERNRRADAEHFVFLEGARHARDRLVPASGPRDSFAIIES
jgi:hypothetical protein